jgi:hypothetical protein
MTRFEIPADCAGLGVVTGCGTALVGRGELAEMVVGAEVKSFHDRVVAISAKYRFRRARANRIGFLFASKQAINCEREMNHFLQSHGPSPILSFFKITIDTHGSTDLLLLCV